MGLPSHIVRPLFSSPFIVRRDDSVTIQHDDIDVKAMTFVFDFKATP